MPNQATAEAYESNRLAGFSALAGDWVVLFSLRRQARKRESRS